MYMGQLARNKRSAVGSGSPYPSLISGSRVHLMPRFRGTGEATFTPINKKTQHRKYGRVGPSDRCGPGHGKSIQIDLRTSTRD